ncbi:MAG: hypothetical protein FWH20_03480 [Oscillospiraceae bacterium]|nr:hypothetical protein [Oscillospiraceae bacterium]
MQDPHEHQTPADPDFAAYAENNPYTEFMNLSQSLPPVTKYKRKRTGEKILLAVCLVALFAIFVLPKIIAHVAKRGHIEYISSIQELSFAEPVQISTTGEVIKSVWWTDVKLTKVAEYSITARVLRTRDYYGGVKDSLIPVDAALAWGYMANEQVDDYIKWSQRNRFYYYRIQNGQWLANIGGLDIIALNSANCPLIPADAETARLIRALRKNDYVKIEGYLVNVYYETGRGRWYSMNTSTTRTDTGAGGCEVILVTGVTWYEVEGD